MSSNKKPRTTQPAAINGCDVLMALSSHIEPEVVKALRNQLYPTGDETGDPDALLFDYSYDGHKQDRGAIVKHGKLLRALNELNTTRVWNFTVLLEG